MKEADPSKLGKALSDTTTRRVIIGVLLMLMILPLLTFSETDYSSVYSIREIFWFGRSSCKPSSNPNSIDFYCPKGKPWLTQEGWHEMLRGSLRASVATETDAPSRNLIWLYIPDFNKLGRMGTIPYIPASGKNTSDGAFWSQIDSCAGFEVSPNCPLRYTEMQLITYTP